MGAKKNSGGVPVEVRNIRGVKSFEMTLQPGVIELRGKNGAGKSTVRDAVLASAGVRKGIALAPRDGMPKGEAAVGGVTLAIGRQIRATGEPSIEVLDSSDAFAALVEPGVSGTEARRRARVKAVLALQPLPWGDEELFEVCGEDETLAAAIQQDRGWQDLSLLDLAEAARVAANQMALDQEKLRLAAEASARTLSEEVRALDLGADSKPEASAADLGLKTQAASASVERLRLQVESREALEAKQAEIRGVLGARPDVDKAEFERDEAAAAVEDLEERLATARSCLARANERLTFQAAAARSWDEQHAILSRPAEGPSRMDLEVAEIALREVHQAHAAAVEWEQWAEIRGRISGHREQADDAAVKEARYRELAKGAADRVTAMLARMGLEDFAVADGELHLVLPSGEMRRFEELSFGEKVRAGAKLALRRANEVGAFPVFHFEETLWGALDPEHKDEVHAIALEEGICVLAESPTGGELRAVNLSSALSASEAVA